MADDSTAVRQTEGKIKSIDLVQSGQKNVLYNYRSVTYNFTLSALRITDVNTPSSYRNSAQDLVIVRSGGKGNTGISTTGKDKSANELVAGFNENSPGRFDMFIDNVEIDTIIEPDGPTIMTQPTNISFDVIEPYSINGFMEALQVSAIAAGYPSYSGAPFLLKLQFAGYPDGQDIPQVIPEIEQSTRYFPIIINNLEVTLDERGTKYKVSATGQSDSGAGESSVLKKSVKATGNTIQEMLQDLTSKVTKQLRDDDQRGKNNTLSSNEGDEYRIKFPVWDPNQGFADNGNINDIGKASLVEKLKDNTINSFPDAATSTKPDAYNPRKFKDLPPLTASALAANTKSTPNTAPVSQFSDGKTIHECIESVIKDSEYIKNIAKKLSSKTEWKQVVDEFGMVDYFLIKLEVTNKSTINPDLKKPYQIFTYVVTPRKILYTRFPGYGNETLDAKKLATLSLREYNYIYTGQNLDILNFKLNFNNLFFEALNPALGIENVPPSKVAAGPGNNVDPKSNPNKIETVKANQVPSSPQRPSASLTSVDKSSGGQNKVDAYAKLAKGMHNAIINSQSSLINGEIDILGDPFYVVTGGVGNYNPAPGKTSPRITTDGEAAHNYSQVLITINFRNPIDINPLDQGGRMKFDPQLIPFSGVYSINKLKSTFKEGMFKQSLSIMRVPGQPSPSISTPPIAPSNPGNRISQAPNPLDQTVTDNTPASPVINTDTGQDGSRATTFTLGNQLQRGLPSPGLPGVLSNFTNASGGLGGSNNYLLSQISGATPNIAGNTRIATQLFGGVVPGGINQGIPIQASGVAKLAQQILNPASLVSQTGNTALRQFGITNPNAQLAAVLIGKASQAINQVSVPGSGIGAGSTVNYTPVTPVSSLINSGQTVTAQDVQLQNSTLPTSITAITGAATGLSPSTIAAVANLGSSSAGLINNIGAKALSVTQGTPTDPAALGQQFGVFTSPVSGLSAPLQSKLLGQLSNIASTVPSNTDLAVASSQGVNLKSLSPQGVANLPPTAPYATAPDPAPDTQYIDSIAKSGGPTAVANAYGVKNVASISQNLLSSANLKSALLPSASLGTAGNLLMAAVAGSKYLSGNLQLSNLVGSALSKEAGLNTVQNKFGATMNTGGDLTNSVVNRFGSRSQGTSPLDRLNIQNSGSPQGPDRSSDSGAG